jgi:hypothetical protein
LCSLRCGCTFDQDTQAVQSLCANYPEWKSVRARAKTSTNCRAAVVEHYRRLPQSTGNQMALLPSPTRHHVKRPRANTPTVPKKMSRAPPIHQGRSVPSNTRISRGLHPVRNQTYTGSPAPSAVDRSARLQPERGSKLFACGDYALAPGYGTIAKRALGSQELDRRDRRPPRRVYRRRAVWAEAANTAEIGGHDAGMIMCSNFHKKINELPAAQPSSRFKVPPASSPSRHTLSVEHRASARRRSVPKPSAPVAQARESVAGSLPL